MLLFSGQQAVPRWSKGFVALGFLIHSGAYAFQSMEEMGNAQRRSTPQASESTPYRLVDLKAKQGYRPVAGPVKTDEKGKPILEPNRLYSIAHRSEPNTRVLAMTDAQGKLPTDPPKVIVPPSVFPGHFVGMPADERWEYREEIADTPFRNRWEKLEPTIVWALRVYVYSDPPAIVTYTDPVAAKRQIMRDTLRSNNH